MKLAVTKRDNLLVLKVFSQGIEINWSNENKYTIKNKTDEMKIKEAPHRVLYDLIFVNHGLLSKFTQGNNV